MKLSELKNKLSEVETLAFLLPNGIAVESHFHITEIGLQTKHFIDCGGTIRKESVATMQLWSAGDINHQLLSNKLSSIIHKSQPLMQGLDAEIEVEYQGSETISKYGLSYRNKVFYLEPKFTACLAIESCGSPKEAVAEKEAYCTPGGGCC